jgi:hypothetical protein
MQTEHTYVYLCTYGTYINVYEPGLIYFQMWKAVSFYIPESHANSKKTHLWLRYIPAEHAYSAQSHTDRLIILSNIILHGHETAYGEPAHLILWSMRT